MFYLNKLTIKDFRCHSLFEKEFKEGINIIFGQNAVGKTSVVEAIYYLAFAKSFKNVKDIDLIKENSNNLYIKGSFLDENKTMSIEIASSKEEKIVKKDEKPLKKVSELVGVYKIALFSPDDLLLIKGDPKDRRKFLDVNLCQMEKEYLISLKNLKKIVKERNEYLKNTLKENIDHIFLNSITEKYIEESKKIIESRKKFISELNLIVKEMVEKISGKKENVNIKYIPNVDVDNLWITSKRQKEIDILAKTTTWGPQRDDCLITLEDKCANNTASQGQIRTVCLAIKLALIEWFKKSTDKIIVILDDVLSELDEERQNAVLGTIKSVNQAFITCTSISNLSNIALDGSNIIELKR